MAWCATVVQIASVSIQTISSWVVREATSATIGNIGQTGSTRSSLMRPWQGLSNSSERHPLHPWDDITGRSGGHSTGAVSGAFCSGVGREACRTIWGCCGYQGARSGWCAKCGRWLGTGSGHYLHVLSRRPTCQFPDQCNDVLNLDR
jgi:hypothetical protein